MKLSASSRDYSEASQLSQEADTVACEGCAAMGIMGCCRICNTRTANCRRGLWSPEEDQRLREYVLEHGHGSWSSLPARAGLQRNGKSCRLRWINYLRPGLKHGAFTLEEKETVLKLHAIWGNKWSGIAMQLPGRTDNEVKNYWNIYLKKKLLKADGSTPQTCAVKSNGSNNQKLELFSLENNSPISLSEISNSGHESICSRPPLGKVLFAEWLLMLLEKEERQSSSDSGVNFLQESSTWSEAISPQDLEVDKKMYTDGNLGQFEDTTVHGDLQQQQFETEEQTPGANLQHLLSFHEGYTGFELNNDDLLVGL